jgi:hypothetical protein
VNLGLRRWFGFIAQHQHRQVLVLQTQQRDHRRPGPRKWNPNHLQLAPGANRASGQKPLNDVAVGSNETRCGVTVGALEFGLDQKKAVLAHGVITGTASSPTLTAQWPPNPMFVA